MEIRPHLFTYKSTQLQMYTALKTYNLEDQLLQLAQRLAREQWTETLETFDPYERYDSFPASKIA